MRVVFMGTPSLAATVFRELCGHVDVVAAYTRPDAVRGRGRKLAPSPVKEAALAAGVEVRTSATLRDEAAIDGLRALEPDAICVAAYGAILPKAVLDIPMLGCFNVHSSLLPRWRGAAPIERAILEGDDETGVCIMRMEEGLDTGPVCKREAVRIGSMDVSELSNVLATLGGRLLVEALERAEAGGLVWAGQDDADATYARKIAKGELDADPHDGAAVIWRKVRASSPAHPSKASVAGRTLTLEEVRVPDDRPYLRAGAALGEGDVAFTAKRLFFGAADGAIEVLRVKPDGKKSMDASSFASGIQGIKNQGVTWGRA